MLARPPGLASSSTPPSRLRPPARLRGYSGCPHPEVVKDAFVFNAADRIDVSGQPRWHSAPEADTQGIYM
eukprot:1793294-Alexandrium_andersonii.AAC.1